MSERWLDIKQFPGYKASSLGRIASYKARSAGGWVITDRQQRILKPSDNSKGYLGVNLSHAGTCHYLRVAALVSNAFLGPPPTGMEICHNDGEPSNNEIENLRYDTPKGNCQDKIFHGTYGKFSIKQIRVMRRLRSNGAPCSLLAKMFKTSAPYIGRICSGAAYSSVGGPITIPTRVHNNKITQADARLIRTVYAQGGITMRDLGARFGISISAISLIVNGKRWAP